MYRTVETKKEENDGGQLSRTKNGGLSGAAGGATASGGDAGTAADQEPQRARLRRPVVVRADQLRSIVSVCTKIPSARNQQVLRFRLVLADEAPGVLARVRMGGALPELHLPLAGTEPNAFIVVCSTVPEDRWVDIDLGIAVQSMLLRAVEIGLNGLCIGAFDRDAIRTRLRLPANRC